MTYLKLISAALTLFLTACTASPRTSNPADGNADGRGPSERVFGTVEYYGEPAQVEVPGSVRQGQPFTVSVTTYGNSCVEKGETKVEIEALRAEIRPYDYDTSSFNGSGCDIEHRTHKHMVTLGFGETGTAEVVFYGLKEGAGGVTQTSVTRTLEVR